MRESSKQNSIKKSLGLEILEISCEAYGIGKSQHTFAFPPTFIVTLYIDIRTEF